MRVIVIGAGLGGLGLAQALLREGIDAEVYERDEGLEARFQGYRVGLGPEALAALRRCLPERLHPLLDAVAGELTGDGRAVDAQLNELGRTPADDEGLLFDRHVLRHLLFAGLRERVRFGKKLDGYEELPDGAVRARFSDGTSVTGDVLVGADGMGSTVRRQMLPHVPILDTGVSGVIGRTPLTERFEGLVPGWSTLVLGGDLRLFLGKMPFRRPPHLAAAELAPDVRLPATPSYLRWVILVPPDYRRAGGPSDDAGSTGGDWQAEYDGQDGVDVVLDLTQGWHPELREMIRQADRHNSGIGPIRYADLIDPWPTRPVTLLGDSAHPMPPGGLGANLAFLDADLLSRKLAEVSRGDCGLLPALEDYERGMHASAAAVHRAAMKSLALFDDMRSRA
jgi:2-polyprenyl-6-methoxyphenol hydroxylase-like FAD-dependent oxidoreductase